MRKLAALAVFFGVLSVLFTGCGEQAPKPITLTILYTNDSSGNIDPCG